MRIFGIPLQNDTSFPTKMKLNIIFRSNGSRCPDSVLQNITEQSWALVEFIAKATFPPSLIADVIDDTLKVEFVIDESTKSHWLDDSIIPSSPATSIIIFGADAITR